MMRMVSDLNGRFLPSLESRAEPAVRIECATCHRGAPVPRMLEDVLNHTYEAAGIDSTLSRYHALHKEYYGRFAYDFGDEPLLFVGSKLIADDHPGDAARIFELNVEEHPESDLAKNRRASAAVLAAFFEGGRERGEAEWRRLRAAYPEDAFSEGTLNSVGYRLLREERVEDAIAAFRLNVEAYPKSANVYDSLGEAYMEHGDHDRAVRNYRKVLEIDPANAHAKEQLKALEGR
jgi:tetratricopeptide (TPR) repeat protein